MISSKGGLCFHTLLHVHLCAKYINPTFLKIEDFVKERKIITKWSAYESRSCPRKHWSTYKVTGQEDRLWAGIWKSAIYWCWAAMAQGAVSLSLVSCHTVITQHCIQCRLGTNAEPALHPNYVPTRGYEFRILTWFSTPKFRPRTRILCFGMDCWWLKLSLRPFPAG